MKVDQAIAEALKDAELGSNISECVRLFKASLRKKGFMVLPLSTDGLEGFS